LDARRGKIQIKGERAVGLHGCATDHIAANNHFDQFTGQAAPAQLQRFPH
jgi:hypothetical protein